jgi:hypothetical protein
MYWVGLLVTAADVLAALSLAGSDGESSAGGDGDAA